MYAIIETGGKQIKVEQGSKIFVEKLDAEVGSDVKIEKVLFIGGESTKVGAPTSKALPSTAKSRSRALAKRSASSSTRPKPMSARPSATASPILA